MASITSMSCSDGFRDLLCRLFQTSGDQETQARGFQDLGSEFTVRLPLVAGGEPARPETAAPSIERASTPVAARKVLVVDDNRDAADSLAMMLDALGHETCTAYDGLEAIEIAGDCRPDVVLLDIGMPKLNGYDACRRIRQAVGGDAIVIVALTGWGQAEDRHRSREAGFDHHLVKPVEPEALEAILLQPSRPAAGGGRAARPIAWTP